jgi:hypothetical protein
MVPSFFNLQPACSLVRLPALVSALLARLRHAARPVRHGRTPPSNLPLVLHLNRLFTMTEQRMNVGRAEEEEEKDQNKRRTD